MKPYLSYIASWILAAAALAESPTHVATTPVPRDGEGWWVERHAKCVEITKAGGVDLAFLGDSITQGWEGQPAWEKHFAPLKAANFGFSGDRTEHVLWRLANGELVGLTPKLIVVMIGTNNLGHNSSNPQQTADGVKTIVSTLRSKIPAAKILLLGIFPRDEKPDGALRKKVAEATSLFKGVADGQHVHFLDIGAKFLNEDGSAPKDIMPDFLHLSPKGYDIWAAAIAPKIEDLLK
ncbi:MAG: platelet-activating factor acetylhydrolase IB subunit [Verrucomicrobiales bacterium]